MIWRKNENLNIGDRVLPKPVYIALKKAIITSGILHLEVFFSNSGALSNGHQRRYTRSSIPQSMRDFFLTKIEQLPQLAGATRTGMVWHQPSELMLNGRSITVAYAKADRIVIDFANSDIFLDMVFAQNSNFGITENQQFQKDKVPQQITDYFLAELSALPQMAGAELLP